MNYDATLINYFLNASIVVKSVMILLIAASIISWSCILQRFFYLQAMKKNMNSFVERLGSFEDLNHLYAALKSKANLTGIEAIFYAGYKEFSRLMGKVSPQLAIDNTQRALRAAQIREQGRLETNLPFLAIVGSTSPYVGLFGTVWGIMQALRALANASQATIAMVAPGMAEALIATALGLFAAIPAVIAYNRFLTDSAKLLNRFESFQDEFINLLNRQTHLGRTNPQRPAFSQSPMPADKTTPELDLLETTVE